MKVRELESYHYEKQYLSYSMIILKKKFCLKYTRTII